MSQINIFYLTRKGWLETEYSMRSAKHLNISSVDFGKYWASVWSSDSVESPDVDTAFAVFNGEKNPLANLEGQKKIRSLGVSHTSMSVGDIVEIDGVKYFCDSFGWEPVTLA